MSDFLPTRVDPPPKSDEGTWWGFIIVNVLLFVLGLLGIILGIIAVIVAVPLSVALMLLIFCLITIFGLATTVLLLVCLLVTRIFQLIRADNEYRTLCFYKNLIRSWLYGVPFAFLWGLWLFYPIVKYAPPLKQVTLAEVPLTKWIKVISIMSGLSSFSAIPYMLVMQIFHKLVKNGSTSNVGQAIVEIFDSLIFWWATKVLMKHVPSIKHHQILGLPTRDWIWVSVVFLIGYNILFLFTRLIVLLLQLIVSLLASEGISSWKSFLSSWKSFLKKKFHVNYAVYVANGMKASTCLVLSSLSLLITWSSYFGSHLDLNSPSVKRVWEKGRWSFISLLTFSVLWLIKTFVLLVWDAHTVYHRLRHQIFSASEQLYFLGILGSLKHNFFKLQLHPEDIIEGTEKDFIDLVLSSLHLPGGPIGTSPDHLTVMPVFLRWIDCHIPPKVSKYFNLLPKVRETVQDDLLMQDPKDSTLDDIHRATQHFFQAQQSLAEETYIDHIMQNFHPNGIINLKWKKLILGEKVNNYETDKKHERSDVEKEKVQSGVVWVISLILKTLILAKKVNNYKTDKKHERSDAEKEKVQSGPVSVAQNSNQNARGKNEEIEEEEPPVAESSSGENPNPTSDGSGDWTEDLKRFREKLDDIKKENSQLGKPKQENLDPDELPYSISDIETWVDGAHKECVKMVNTLSSAKELSDCLNKIISWLLIGAIFIMWLLLTGLATTKVLVLIASPLLAASFIFGDTSKTLFEGIIYVYVVHPLYVGELCVVDNKMLEVKTVGVWKTTFTKVGTSVEVIYPNTDLKNKYIVNYKTDYDWDFNVELCVRTISDEKIYKLKEDIGKYLTGQRYEDVTVEVMVMTIAESGTKIAISFYHDAKGENAMMTYDTCQKLKRKILSEFILHLRKHMDQEEIEVISIQGTKESEREITSDTGKE